jgi:hypothetical protein
VAQACGFFGVGRGGDDDVGWRGVGHGVPWSVYVDERSRRTFSMAFFLLSCYAFSMQITVTIPDDFAAQVQARGLAPESFGQSVIDDAVRSAPLPLPPAKPRMDMETFLREMAAFSDKIPQLPDEAFTRESFYQDHD